jgi:hypothetical protein
LQIKEIITPNLRNIYSELPGNHASKVAAAGTLPLLDWGPLLD